MDIKPLIDTLSKVSEGRVLPFVDVRKDGDLEIAKVPVRARNDSDKTDLALRRYASDWLKRQAEVSVDTRFEELRGVSWFSDDGTETPIVGALVISWWPRPKMSEFDALKKLQEENRARARRGSD